MQALLKNDEDQFPTLDTLLPALDRRAIRAFASLVEFGDIGYGKALHRMILELLARAKTTATFIDYKGDFNSQQPMLWHTCPNRGHVISLRFLVPEECARIASSPFPEFMNFNGFLALAGKEIAAVVPESALMISDAQVGARLLMDETRNWKSDCNRYRSVGFRKAIDRAFAVVVTGRRVCVTSDGYPFPSFVPPGHVGNYFRPVATRQQELANLSSMGIPLIATAK